jgi:hypothetical protein
MMMKIPAAAEFRAAFLALRPYPDKHLQFLKFHYAAPDFTITATDLAKAVGYAKHNAINLQYGKLAERFCEHFGQKPEKPETNLTILITDYSLADKSNEHAQLTLRPEVVEALAGLSWFRKAPVAVAVAEEA